MKHFPFLLSLAAGLGTACILGGFSAAADSAGVTVPVRYLETHLIEKLKEKIYVSFEDLNADIKK